MKKIGLICLAVVLGVGALGIGYAHWDDQLYINGTVETGEVLIGFIYCCTDDDNDYGADLKPECQDESLDPLWPGEVPPEVCTQCLPGDKDVAETTCWLDLETQRIHSDGETPAEHEWRDLMWPEYEKLWIDIDNAYPQYNPTVFFEIANCGSIPVVIESATVIMTSVGGDETTVNIPLPKCTMVPVDLDGDDDFDVYIGFSGPVDQQLDECDVKQFDLHFYFTQDLDECTDYDFEIKIHAVQWNKAILD